MSTAHTTKKPDPKPTSKTESTAKGPQANGGNGDPNEGEGNRTAARRYNEETREYIASGHSDEAAQAAKKALDGPEGKELRAAEKTGKAGHPNVKPS